MVVILRLGEIALRGVDVAEGVVVAASAVWVVSGWDLGGVREVEQMDTHMNETRSSGPYFASRSCSPFCRTSIASLARP